MVYTPTWKVLIICSAIGLAAATVGCSSTSAERAELRAARLLEEQREQERLDRQRLAGLESGLARSLEPSVYAARADDTLANLLGSGETVFSALSAAIRRDFLGADSGAAHPSLGGAYVKSVADDGAGGFRVALVIDGRESVVHFRAEETNARNVALGEAEDNLTAYTLFPWTHSFRADPNDPSTDGSYTYDYLDLKGWTAGAVAWNQIRGFVAYGARTMAENLAGRASYQGRVQAEFWNTDDPDWNTQTRLLGTLHLEANLDDGEIRGRIDDLLAQPPGTATYRPMAAGNVIDIASTPIDAARFSAAWVGNDPNVNAAPDETIHGFSGHLLGEFYGPAAEEIGGVMGGRRAATDSTPEQFLIGGFHGSRPGPGQ